jgi:2-iminobutanoate/2-iminopropanoate deaminase
MSRMSLTALVALTVVVAAMAVTHGQRPERRYIAARTAADTGQPPFSGAVLAGDTLYLSGALGLTPDGTVPEDVEAEARAVMESVKRNVTAAGLTMDDLVYVQIFCSDVAHYDVFNRVYRTYFQKEYPARAFIGSGTLLRGARFEVQGIAVRR